MAEGSAPTEPQSGPATRPPWLWWAFGGGIAVVLLALFFFLSRVPSVAVPQTVGMTQAQAEAAITAAGLRVGKASEVQTLAAAPGVVVDQSPVAEAQVDEGSPVDLSVAAIPIVKVPDVVGQNVSTANESIAVAGLRPGAVNYVYDDKVSAGLITAQDPAAGTQATVATAVNVTVSKGVEQGQVPNVVGLSEADAKSTVEAAGFTSTVVKASSSVPAGDVSKQSPAAGVVTAAGSTVTLTVSTGPAVSEAPPTSEPGAPAAPSQPEPPAQPSTPPDSGTPEKPVPPANTAAVPDVVGKGILEAITTVKKAGLKVAFDYGPSKEYLLRISAQDPEAGVEVDKGSVVTLTIGLPEFLFGGGGIPTPTPLPAPGAEGSSDASTTP